MKKTLCISLICLMSSNYVFAEECEHKFILKDKDGSDWYLNGKKQYGCYATNYNNYSSKQAANEFLQDQVFIEGGQFNLNNNPKTFINISSYYLGKYLVPYQEYNAYLRATDQWHDGDVTPYSGLFKEYNQLRLGIEKYNGLYPATATYENAEGFCKWMGEQTGLDVTLPNYQQWLYAATSRGKNWDYPTNNGKLELGINFPDTPSKVIVSVPANQIPINSLGIYQIFGNGMQWTSSIYSKKNAPYFNVWSPSGFGGNIAGGTYYPTPDQDASILKKMTLMSDFARAQKPDKDTEIHFRCVINTDKPLPSVTE